MSLRDLAPSIENINKPQSTSHRTESQIPTEECNEIVPDVHETDPSFTHVNIVLRFNWIFKGVKFIIMYPMGSESFRRNKYIWKLVYI